MKRPDIKALFNRIDAMPRRDRTALLLGSLALLAGVELQGVMSLHDKRVSVARQQQEPALAAAQAKAEAAAQRTERLAQLKSELAKIDQDLAQRGVGVAPQAVFAAMKQWMSLQGVRVWSLETLEDENAESLLAQATTAAGALAAASAAAAPANDAAAANPAVQPPIKAFRHRAKLQVAGTLAEVSDLLQALEAPSVPMRLEHIRLVPSEQDTAVVLATFELVTVSQETSWLAL